MIGVTDLVVSLSGTTVLDGVDLDVGPGELVGLVGPNGAGKTTLLAAINGIHDADSGAVTVDGVDAGSVAADERARHVATVRQGSAVGFGFTVGQVVEMGRTPHRGRLDWSGGGRPVERALERTGTARFRDRRVDELSGGERQRVLLARALAQDTPALLLDEPTASLDINHQVRVFDIVTDLVADGRAVLAAIHDLTLAARFCDRLCLLHDGRIRARGPPAEVLTDDALSTAFDTPVSVSENPVTGTPSVTAHRADGPGLARRVHVVGGGDAGARAVRALARAGCTVTVGPVAAGDRAAAVADRLGCEVVTAPPFATPGDATERARELARAADSVLDTGGPGSGVLGTESVAAPVVKLAGGDPVHTALSATGPAAADD